MKSFGLCHEIISPVILKSFGLSQDLPLSQNGQKFRRAKNLSPPENPKFSSREIFIFLHNTSAEQNIKFSEGDNSIFMIYFSELKSD